MAVSEADIRDSGASVATESWQSELEGSGCMRVSGVYSPYLGIGSRLGCTNEARASSENNTSAEQWVSIIIEHLGIFIDELVKYLFALRRLS